MMMMQSDNLIQTSWPVQSYYQSEHHEILSSINSTPENSMISSGLYGCEEYPLLCYDQVQNISTLDDVCRWLCDDDQELEEIQSMITTDDVMEESIDVMEPEPKSGLESLLKAYAEAMSMGQIELAKVIVKCISEKVNPVGQTMERIAFSMFLDNQDEYFKQESMRNFKVAFRVFYEIFPFGRFAHFTANSTILDSVPASVESIHIVDFDLCEGSQWPHVIQAIAQMNKSLIITSIKLDQDQDSQFAQTRWHLCKYAQTFGLNLKVQEIRMSELVNKMDERQQASEFMVFNCMVNLPHMTKTRKSHQVFDFLKLAKLILTENQGIITFGDGEESKTTKNQSDFPSFFNKNLTRYNALYKSIESGLPSYLNQARISMETLFLAPFVSSKSWIQKWEERREFTSDFPSILGLTGVKMSMESWNEARELVKEGESGYGIRVEGGNGNEMVLEWNGIPLVRVCAWV
ncbi:protein NODULATION SIGNALING PATHWAY 2-like [Bidens hawaiensis]|uniref:protein NODULATION SIGNALING PATHWAY 2-like n=1 Tax=Bidens hawaiensis TaxID=980011 RepID=UPI00404A7E50